MKAEFTKLRDRDCASVLPREGASVADWETQTFLSSASLIAKSCQAAMMLAHHPKSLQDAAFEFGKHIGFAHRASGLREILSLRIYFASYSGKDVFGGIRVQTPSHPK